MAGGDISLPLDERPWEMFEYLAPLPTTRRHRDQFLASKTYPDNAAIPAGLFAPLIKRDALPTKVPIGEKDDEDDGDDPHGWLHYISERDLGDGIAGHPLAGRYLATDAYSGPDDLDSALTNVPLSAAGPAMGMRDLVDLSRLSPSNASTASSVPLAQAPRRQSTRIALHSSTGTGTNNDPIAIDDDDHDTKPDLKANANLKTNSKANRNGDDSEEDSSDSSSEEEVLRKPPAKRPRVAGKAPTKKTAGKAPARKTVGGKAVARKGGKSVKGLRR